MHYISILVITLLPTSNLNNCFCKYDLGFSIRQIFWRNVPPCLDFWTSPLQKQTDTSRYGENTEHQYVADNECLFKPILPVAQLGQFFERLECKMCVKVQQKNSVNLHCHPYVRLFHLIDQPKHPFRRFHHRIPVSLRRLSWIPLRQRFHQMPSHPRSYTLEHGCRRDSQKATGTLRSTCKTVSTFSVQDLPNSRCTWPARSHLSSSPNGSQKPKLLKGSFFLYHNFFSYV